MDNLEREMQEKVKRPEQAEKLIAFLERAKIFDEIEKIKSNSSHENVSFEEFKNFLVRVNGIARDVPVKERKFDGENVVLSGVVGKKLMPKYEDKEPLVKYAYDNVPNLKFPEDKKYILASVINAVHPFNDGNGRTGRLIYLLLDKKVSKEDQVLKIRQALGSDGRFDSVDISSGLSLVQYEIARKIEEQYGWKSKEKEKFPVMSFVSEKDKFINNQSDTTKEEKEKILDLVQGDIRFMLICAYEYINQKNLLEDVLFINPQGEKEKRFSLLRMDQIFKLEDWNIIVNNYYLLKKQAIENLIGIFIEPEKYLCEDGKTTLRDYFIANIKKQL
ncbi:MAG: Fic family protein [Patescibacteria group bacterium]